MFNHDNKNKINEILLKDLFNNTQKNYIIKDNNAILCDNCKKLPIDYSCINCKRNICKNCFNYHKSHKFYENNKYLLSQETLNNNFTKAKEILNNNLSLIENQINIFKSQIKLLENLFQEYKNINDKLIYLSNYILDNYSTIVSSKKPVYYPLYYNLKNVLLFNFQELKLPNDDITIKSYSDMLFEKINSGSYFLLNYSDITNNLNDSNKNTDDIINLNLINLD